MAAMKGQRGMALLLGRLSQSPASRKVTRAPSASLGAPSAAVQHPATKLGKGGASRAHCSSSDAATAVAMGDQRRRGSAWHVGVVHRLAHTAAAAQAGRPPPPSVVADSPAHHSSNGDRNTDHADVETPTRRTSATPPELLLPTNPDGGSAGSPTGLPGWSIALRSLVDPAAAVVALLGQPARALPSIAIARAPSSPFLLSTRRASSGPGGTSPKPPAAAAAEAEGPPDGRLSLKETLKEYGAAACVSLSWALFLDLF